MGWICSCGEGLDDSLLRCWNCGNGKHASAAPAVASTVADSGSSHQPLSRGLPGEQFVARLSGQNLVLSTHRLRSETVMFGQVALVSIMLEEIASSALIILTRPMLLIIAVVIAAIAFLTMIVSFKMFVVGAIIAGCFVLAYFLTQRRVLSFASAGASINVTVGETSDDLCRNFLDLVENAKAARQRR
jgi:hypothetical protein